jgi:MFS family permease
VLFHLANAPLLPLVGQKLALSHKDLATAMMSACIIAAQLIMLPIAVAVGRTADRIGRKSILLIGFAVLPIRAVLYPLSDQALWLVSVQLLDGIGAGIFGAITPLLIADLLRGTGRYNLAQGAIATLQGIGASSSGLLAGEIVDHLGYSPAFMVSAAIALVAFLVLAIALPESAEDVSAKVPRVSEVWFRLRRLLPAQAAPGAVRMGSSPGPERGEK